MRTPNDGQDGGRDPAMSRALDKARQRWPAYTRDEAHTCGHLRKAAELRGISDLSAHLCKTVLDPRITALEQRYREECARDGCLDAEPDE